MEKKIQKKFFLFNIIEFQLRVANSQNLEHDTCHRQSICKEKYQRFHVTLGETFSKSNSMRMMKKHDKSALMEISQVFGTLSHVDLKSLF